MSPSPLVHVLLLALSSTSHPCLSPRASSLCLSDRHLTSVPITFSSELTSLIHPFTCVSACRSFQSHRQYANHVLSCICCSFQWLPVERMKSQTPFKVCALAHHLRLALRLSLQRAPVQPLHCLRLPMAGCPLSGGDSFKPFTSNFTCQETQFPFSPAALPISTHTLP